MPSNSISSLAFLALALPLSAAELRVPAYTAYSLPEAEAVRISRRGGVTRWTDPAVSVNWYGQFKQTGALQAKVVLRLPAGAESRLQLTADAQSREAVVQGAGAGQPVTADFGTIEIARTGYVRFALAGLNALGQPFGDLEALLLEGPAVEGAHFNLKERRNAASVHLAYPVPKGTNVAAFYCEVTALEDPTASFYMACGWHRGYFGMQVNSPTERRIIFSVWDSGDEAVDRNKVSDENRVTLMGKGEGVFSGDFGNEGTGGHSHLKYLWKTGETHRFIVTAQPTNGNFTVFSGFYFHPDQQAWMLISSWKAPQEGGWLRGLHSFSENFWGSNGHVVRKALYGNQWIRTDQGAWIELATATFSHDPTGRADRLDRFMGVEKGQFFLSHGGFVEGFSTFGDRFTRPAVGSVPADIAVLTTPVGRAGDTLDLAGEWRLRLDAEDQGAEAGWPARPLAGDDRIVLPNTTDRAGFGFALDTNTMTHAAPFPVTTRFPGVKDPVRADEHGYLVRSHLFVGPAWYERTVEIPEAWRGRPSVLRLERALWKTDVWVDGREAGACDSLVAEHGHELGVLAPGSHRLTVRVDNRMIHNLSTVTHAYGPETQSRWNGLIGRIRLEAFPALSVRAVAAFPAPDRQSVRVVLRLDQAVSNTVTGSVTASLFAERGEDRLATTTQEVVCPAGSSTNELVLRLAEPALAWDEFQPVRYRLRVAVESPTGPRHEAEVKFGFRHVERSGKEIRVNGRRVFLRGTLDCAVYPQTGHPPMTDSEWERVLGVVREYGFNHVRFHTWCPPEAAFEVADRLGLYLQPEAPAWVDDWGTGTVTKPLGVGRDPQVAAFLRSELHRMIAAYGNHPSFLLCAIGNEFGMQSADWDWVDATVRELKTLDPRRLYTGCGARKNLPADDFWFTHQTGAGTRGVGPAHTDWDFARAADTAPVPVIAHETGQRPVFPDYDVLLPKFTGPLLPLNYERFRRMLVRHGLEGQTKDFVRASARFQNVQYKAEHEAMRRTREYAGYQLLMLNDFTGQSEALVGILDPFWETKGVVSPAEVRAWNAPTVLLARFPKYVWTARETLHARVEIAHHGPQDLPAGPVLWSVTSRGGQVRAQGQFDAGAVPTGGVADLGAVSVPLEAARPPEALTLTVRFAQAENSWNLWVYPDRADDSAEPSEVLVTTHLDDKVRETLREGRKVLYLAHGLKNPHVAQTGFESVYWSAGWWGNRHSALGVLCDPAHPALSAFPNDGCSDWQWHELCSGATTFAFESVPPGFRPIVQPVPDFHFNTCLAQVFEVRVDAGAMLVCGYDLTRSLDRRPAARQLRLSLLRYASSSTFQPAVEVTWPWIEAHLGVAGLRRLGATIHDVDSEDTAHGNRADQILDGDPSTFWHTRWQPRDDPMPHTIVVDLGRDLDLRGLTVLPRQDQANGRIAHADIFASLQPGPDWGTAQAVLTGQEGTELRTVLFPQTVRARYLRLVVTSALNGQPFAAIAELDVLAGAPAR